jgi:hypothetical protein
VNLTATLNPYDLYKFDLAMNGTGGKDYARFSKHHAKAIKDAKRKLRADDVVTLDAYLNDADVRAALHIPTDIQTWYQCIDDSEARWEYVQQEEASEWIYQVLKLQAKSPSGSNLRMMHYSGDTDGVVPTYGTKQWI